MSPTVIQEHGYRVLIYFNDHDPAHVHVKKDKKEARVQLDPVEVMNSYGYKRNELKVVVTIVETYQQLLIETWNAIYGSGDNDEDASGE